METDTISSDVAASSHDGSADPAPVAPGKFDNIVAGETVVRFFVSKDAPSCPALVVECDGSGSASLKVMPNKPSNPAKPRDKSYLAKGVPFAKDVKSVSSTEPATQFWTR